MHAAGLPDLLRDLVGKAVVIDVRARYVYLGRLAGGDAAYLALEQADVHDLRDTTTTREEYVLTAKRFGLNPNRRRVLVRLDEAVSVSLLDDVLA